DYKVPDAQALASLDEAERRTRAAAVDQPGDGATDFLPPESEAPPVPPWVDAWHDSRVNVAILAALLSVLTSICLFQATLARPRPAAMEPVGCAREAPVDGQVHRGRGRAGVGADGDRPGGGDPRDRAVQDCDHLEIHSCLALCALRRCLAGNRAVLGAGLLPL